MTLTSIMKPISKSKGIMPFLRILKSLFILGLLVSSFQTKSFGQTKSDESIILQKCLDLNSVQMYYPVKKDGSGEKQQLRILQYPHSFSARARAEKYNSEVLFVARDYTRNLDAYFSFTTFSLAGNTATVSFNITYDRNTANPHSVKVEVSLEKTAGNWNIINSNLIKL